MEKAHIPHEFEKQKMADRPPYPTDEEGLPLPVEEQDCMQEGCKYYPGCSAQRHHLAHPKAEYIDNDLGNSYRELGRMINIICRDQHDRLHLYYQPPPKPSDEVMTEVVIREIKRSQA